MAQPDPYTPVTNFAEDELANAGGRSSIRTDRLDAELAAINDTTDGILACLAAIQRDDTKLLDGLIEYYNLSTACKAALLATKWNARGLWATPVAYAVSDMVDVSGYAYVCAIAHTSGVFATDYAAGKWQIFVQVANAGSSAFTPTTNILSTNIQSAAQEIDTNARNRSLSLLAAFYGAI